MTPAVQARRASPPSDQAMPVAPLPAHRHRQRPWLGLRDTPGRLALAVFRMPLRLYRRGWGWMLGRTFLLLVHVGRKTGRLHDTVAMVLADDPKSGEVVTSKIARRAGRDLYPIRTPGSRRIGVERT